jgi:succinate dehydrogenase/fumarate reductase flavoprotein subunit
MSAAPTVDISNVLVIGSGAAGVRAAIAAREAGVEVTVLGRRARRDAHTTLAAGGINAVLGTQDPRTPGSSTSPTRCARATSSPTPRPWRSS